MKAAVNSLVGASLRWHNSKTGGKGQLIVRATYDELVEQFTAKASADQH
jgi:hypothetical protein